MGVANLTSRLVAASVVALASSPLFAPPAAAAPLTLSSTPVSSWRTDGTGTPLLWSTASHTSAARSRR